MQVNLAEIILPGPVEIDETLYYKAKRGFHGRIVKIKYWVFGLFCR